MAFIIINETGRITAASRTCHCGKGEIEVELPEKEEGRAWRDYRYVNGDFIYDPQPEPEQPEPEPTADELINALLGVE